MSPPSSRNPPPTGDSDSRTDRRNARTVLEVPKHAAPDARVSEKRTMFGFALPTLGIDRGAGPEVRAESSEGARAPTPTGVAIGRVAGVGQAQTAHPAAPQPSLAQTAFHAHGGDPRADNGFTMTEPQYVLPARAPTALKEELSDAHIAPVHRAPPSAFHGAPAHSPPIATARLAHTPVPARERYAAETHELPPVASGEPPSTLEMDNLYGAAREVSQRAPAAAPLAAAIVSPRVGPATLEAPDARTAFVDVRALAAAQQMALPQLRDADATGRDDTRDGDVWQGPSGSRPETPAFRGPPGSHAARAFGRQGEQEGVDLDVVLGRAPRRTLLLGGVSAFVVLLAGLSFLLTSSPDEKPQLRTVASAVAPHARTAAPRATPRARQMVAEQESAAAALGDEADPTAVEAAPSESSASAARGRDNDVEQSVRAVRRQPDAPSESERPQPAARAEHVSATPERAAILYIEGKYKQALAEYRLLAAAYPSQKVYSELARILKRKIVDTCLRTQPNRREQCKTL